MSRKASMICDVEKEYTIELSERFVQMTFNKESFETMAVSIVIDLF